MSRYSFTGSFQYISSILFPEMEVYMLSLSLFKSIILPSCIIEVNPVCLDENLVVKIFDILAHMSK